MKTLRPAAKGIRSIRHCIWALQFDFRGYSVSEAGKVAAKCTLFPGGEDAAWFLVHASFIQELDEHDTLTAEEAISLIYTRFKDDNDRRLALYFVARAVFRDESRSLLCARASALGCKRSKYYIDSDRRAVSSETVERDALSGSYQAAKILAEKLETRICEFDRDDLFWEIVMPMVHHKRCDGFKKFQVIEDFPPVQAYEYGILFLDAAYHGFKVETLGGFENFALNTNAAAKRGIETWLVIAKRFGVVKDIRRVIGLLLWAERAEWAATVVKTTKKNKNKK